MKTIFFFLIFSFQLISQETFKEQFNYAKNLYDEEKYFDAVTELKRLQFFDKDGEYLYSANELMGQSYKMGGKFSDALKYFTIAEINAQNIDEFYHTKIEIIRINILRRTTSNALKLLNQLEEDYRFSDKINEINYWRGWTYIFADDWERAEKEFNKIDQQHELKILSAKVEKEKYSVLTSKILSYIIPGAGQFYTGNYLSGLLSLSWNVLWGYLTINAFVEERVFDGIMIGNFLWLRFYRGNIQNAEKFAVEKNIEISNKALHYLQFEFKGTKP